MKTTIFAIMMILSTNIWSQYQSVFGKDTTQWNVTYAIIDYFPTYVYKAFGDTAINDLNYKVVYEGNQWILGNKYGFLREDTVEGKLWFLSLNNQEKLIMDLSLEKSDTFKFETDFEYTADTVFYIEGKKTISFNGNSEDSIAFKEGIGPYNIFYFRESQDPTIAYIRCMFKDNVLVYKNSSCTECTDNTQITNTTTNATNIFYNPTTNTVSFDLPEDKIFLAEFYNSIGVLVQKNKVRNNAIIDINQLSSGIYTIRIISNNQILSSKFLKR